MLTTPNLTITPFARDRIDQVRANRRRPDAGIRIALTGRNDGAFQWDMQLAGEDEPQAGDIVVDVDGIDVHLPTATVPYVEGAVLDAEKMSGALRITTPQPLWLDPLAAEVQAFLDAEINPSVAGHGGHIDLLEVGDGVAYIHMGGGCQGCGMASVTLSQGVRVALLDHFPDIVDVLDTTDHAAGANPYYQAAKK